MNAVKEQIVNSKIATASASSVGGGIIGFANAVNPVLEMVSMVISCVAGLLAIWWTIERLIEIKRKLRKDSKKS
jgi:hypothetical protein